MMSVMVELYELVTKIKYLPVASCSLCLPLSQTVNVPNSDILQVENKPTHLTTSQPDWSQISLCFSQNPFWLPRKGRLAGPQADM